MFHTKINRLLRSAAEDELGHKIRRLPRGFAERDAEPEKIFGVHLRNAIQGGFCFLRSEIALPSSIKAS